MLRLADKSTGEGFKPLEQATLLGAEVGTVVIRDALGRAYVQQSATAEVRFRVGGTTGYHMIEYIDPQGVSLERLHFPVAAHTEIVDQDGTFQALLQLLLYTTHMMENIEGTVIRYQGRLYRLFVCWLRDHVHTLKGLKYFAHDLKDGIDLYRATQRDDGMIWDNVYLRTPQPNYWDVRFADGGFIQPFDDYSAELKRIPVECDVEYLFVEGLYYTWKAVGDDAWMAASLDAAKRALEYSVTSPYRWSTRYQLLKRGYTIDTWDFQDEEDAAVVANDAMRVDPEKTHFGVMFGDNTGYSASCRYLAEMLEHVGRADEAQEYRERAKAIKERLDRISWNGRYYTHHVPEESDLRRDLGVDEASQVSLSNAYSLNRGLTHEQCVAIIETYQRIRDDLPPGSPGEWYTIYPPFQRGFGGHNGLWQYMNSGVTPIVAGELAHGAFQHGYESYAVDILRRLLDLGRSTQGRLYCTYTGAFPPRPTPTFTPLDISALANIDIAGAGAPGVPGWTGEGENDLHELPTGEQQWLGIPFQIPDPHTNGRRVGIGLSQRAGYLSQVDLPIKHSVASFCFLHTSSRAGAEGICGTITIHYTDGSQVAQYVQRGRHISGWWFPGVQPVSGELCVAKVAWRGCNKLCPDVGVIAYTLANPHPDRQVERLTLTASVDGALWAIFGVTLSDQEEIFERSPVSFGIPDSWGTGAVIYALIEGLAGVVDAGVAYKHVELAPRWSAAHVEQAQATITYPESGGYVAYNYQHHATQNLLELLVTGSGETCAAHVLLPEGVQHVVSVRSGERELEFAESSVEASRYVDFAITLPGPEALSILYTR